MKAPNFVEGNRITLLRNGSESLSVQFLSFYVFIM